MDVIVKWRDGTENCVSIKDLKCVRKGNSMRIGTEVKMLFKRRWYFGVIVVTENECQPTLQKDTNNNNESSSDESLAVVASKKYKLMPPSNDDDPFHDSDDSNDPDYNPTPKKKRPMLTTCVEVLEQKCKEDNDDQPILSKLKSKSIDNDPNKFTLIQDNLQTVEENIPVNVSRGSSDKTVHLEDDNADNIAVNSISLQEVMPLNLRRDTISSDETICSESLLASHNSLSESNFDNPITCNNAELDTNQPYYIEEETTCSERLLASHDLLGESNFDNPITSANAALDTNQPYYVEELNNFRVQACEVAECIEEVFSACFRCSILLCWSHFDNNPSCDNHQQPRSIIPLEEIDLNIRNTRLMPEDFLVDGSPREIVRQEKENRSKKEINKRKKDLGKEYATQVSNKLVPEKKLGPLCNIENCKRNNRECYTFDEDSRQKLFESFWSLGNLVKQREFIARHVEKVNTKQKTAGPESKRQYTIIYYLYHDGKKKKVCRYCFLNTLAIGERIVKTAIKKLLPTGVQENEKRGGRKAANIEKDKRVKTLVEEHLKRFPRVESHYCRATTTREYLHVDLTIRKMHQMLVEELQDEPKPSLSLYRKIFKLHNLSFHRPKKDQCSICSTYREGTDAIKANLEDKYTSHIQQKQSFRLKRSQRKEDAQKNPSTIACATFDMQQVINLPLSNESAVFYKRRLSVYNFTIYEMVLHDCFCYTWHEGQSKRGASEISTALYLFLKSLDEKGLKKVYLFADGCSGQNKNSIVAATLLYILNNAVSIEEIVLSISVPCHGQSEGDSAHSAIDYAIKKTGDIYIPSQLIPIIKLARRRQPYKVHALSYSDFLDFKTLSRNLRLLSVRKDDAGEMVDWREMMELAFVKTSGNKMFFLNDHTVESYRSITLKDQVLGELHSEILPLNLAQPKVSREKYNDLMALTSGDTPVIRLPEFVAFYRSLPH